MIYYDSVFLKLFACDAIIDLYLSWINHLSKKMFGISSYGIGNPMTEVIVWI